MIEVSMQITCDGCGGDKGYAPEPYDGLSITRKLVRQALREAGWRSYGLLDYCPACVKDGTAARRFKFFG